MSYRMPTAAARCTKRPLTCPDMKTGSRHVLPSPVLEVCCFHAEAVQTALSAGALRIELCAGGAEGGLTPSAGLIAAVRSATEMPLFVLVRPRAGDFCYSIAELAVMLEDIRVAADLGADGIVTGCLDEQGRVDHYALKRLVTAAGSLPVTFHKAIDVAHDKIEACRVVRDSGCRRVLSSGGRARAVDGLSLMSGMIRALSPEVVLMPGGGLEPVHIPVLHEALGATEFHGAFRMQSGLDEAVSPDPSMIAQARHLLDGLNA